MSVASYPPKVAFIIAGGWRIGHSVAERFAHEGYSIAIGREKTQDAIELDLLQTRGVFLVDIDVTEPQSTSHAFAEVTKKLGVPNVVVYNAASLTYPLDPADPFGIIPEHFSRNLTANVTAGYVAIHLATRGFRTIKLQAAARGTCPPEFMFVVTGDLLQNTRNLLTATHGPGRGSLAYLVSVGSQAYAREGFRFFFASQVTTNGGPINSSEMSSSAHADAYWRLAGGAVKPPRWDYRFYAGSEGQSIEYQGPGPQVSEVTGKRRRSN
ncbi:hypothetical protein BX600DRAFT_462507 [Xylariales sp. PMI_506]|nr:hypothetical protein BX600DRAFT_462507 [Xylariales sp. PMI_506]